MKLSAEELGIRAVLILCTWPLSIQTTQQSPFLHNQGEIVWMYCLWEIRVSTAGLELEFSPPQLNALPLSYDAPYSLYVLNLELKFLRIIKKLADLSETYSACQYPTTFLWDLSLTIFCYPIIIKKSFYFRFYFQEKKNDLPNWMKKKNF